MRPLITNKRLRIALMSSLALAALLGVGSYFHFRDDPAPDLSQFQPPFHDAEIYVRFDTTAKEFKKHFVEYAPKHPGDISEFAREAEELGINIIGLADLDLDARALRGDPIALRCLRRHIEENKEALPIAEKLFGLPHYSMPAATRENPFAIGEDTFSQPRIAGHLLTRRATLAALDGDMTEARRVLSIMEAGSRARRLAAGNMIAYLQAVALDSQIADLAVTLAAMDSDAGRVTQSLAGLDAIRPAPNDLPRALEGELRLAQSAMPEMPHIIRNQPDISEQTDAIANEFLTRIGAQPVPKPPAWRTWLKKTGRKIDREWNLLNLRPNATVSEYARRLTPAITSPDTYPEQTPEESAPWFFQRNASGIRWAQQMTSAIPIVLNNRRRAFAQHDLTRLALALRVHRISHDGKYPASLNALTPEILVTLPTDPFDSGKPFRYDPSTGKVWSIGQDRKDDGGDPNSDIVITLPSLTDNRPR